MAQQYFPGMTEAGNIDLTKRPVVHNPDGTISTVRSVGVNLGGQEVLLPTVSDDGRILTVDEAVQQYRKTGKHLGKFSSPEASNAYAQQLHEQQDRMYSGHRSMPTNSKLAAALGAFGQTPKQGLESGLTPTFKELSKVTPGSTQANAIMGMLMHYKQMQEQQAQAQHLAAVHAAQQAAMAGHGASGAPAAPAAPAAMPGVAQTIQQNPLLWLSPGAQRRVP